MRRNHPVNSTLKHNVCEAIFLGFLEPLKNNPLLQHSFIRRQLLNENW